MRLDNPSISGSISYLGGGTNTISGTDAKITGSFTGSFIGEVSGTSSVATTSSYIELSNVDGSASLASRITSNSASIASLETVSGSYANSASFASNISVNSASIASLETVSGSYANSASFASDISTNSSSIGSLNAVSSSYLLNTTDTLTGDLTVTGNIIATTLNVQDVTASVVYSSGSNIFGSSSIDTQQFTGSILTSGSIEVNGDKFTVSGATGDATFAGDVVINNNKFYKAENASGTNYKIAGITNGNEIQIGAIDYTTAGTIFAGGDNISITTGGASGTTRMSIDSSGNSTFSGQVSVGNYAIPSDHQFQIAHLGQSYARFALTNSQTGNGSSDGLIFQMESLNSIIKNQENGSLGFGTNGRETDILIDSSGDVGIGVTGTPSTKLHLGGTAPGDSIIRQDSTVSGTNWEIGERAAGKWQIFEDDADSIVATFMSSGNVGIGDPSPQGKLEVNNRNTATGAALFIKGGEDDLSPIAGQYTGLAFGYGGGDIYNNAAILWEFTNTAANGKLHFAVNPTAGDGTANLSDSKMTILDSGNVGIGTTSPSATEPIGGNLQYRMD